MGSLDLSAVTKRYGKVVAANKVTFQAQAGRILGLLGPNGAGKTTTIRMIANITTPDEGAITLGGRTVGTWSQEIMGYLPEERGLYKKLKVAEQLRYLAELKGMGSATSKPRIGYWLERLGLESWGGRKTQDLSKGMQQKVQFIATVLPEPRLIILDEPFSGLDPINSELLLEIIDELKSDGRTILFASHRMEQVEKICDDICLIARGEVVLYGTKRAIKERYPREKIAIDYRGTAPFLDHAIQTGRLTLVERHEDGVVVQMSSDTEPRAIVERLIAAPDLDLLRFELVQPSMTEIFIRAVGAEA